MPSDAFPARIARIPFYRRGTFWTVSLVAVSLLLGGLFAGLDHHGRRHAAAIEARLKAAGYRQELAALRSANVPEAENFAATQFLSRLTRGSGFSRTPMEELAELARSNLIPDPGMPSPVPWDAVERQFEQHSLKYKKKLLAARAIDASQTLPWTRRFAQQLESDFGAPLVELEQRLALPQATMPGTEIVAGEFFPYWVNWSPRSDWGHVVYLRGWLALAVGDDKLAVRTTQIMWRLAEASDGSPGSQHGITSEPLDYPRCAALLTWMAAGERRWQDDDWRRIQAAGAACDPLRLARALLVVRLASIEAEEAVALEAPDTRVYYLPYSLRLRASHGITPTGELVAHLLPGGWVRATLATARESAWNDLNSFDRDGVKWALSPVPTAPPGWAGLTRYETGVGVAGRPHPLQIREILMSAQALIAMSRTAAALERHWLQHASYPVSLDALQPDFLDRIPLDLDGKPLRYRQDSGNGRYQLWSVGINGLDEGGRSVTAASAGKRRRGVWPWSHDPDWVWSYP